MLRGVKQLPQGHTASKQQSQDSIPGVCDLKSPTLSAPRMRVLVLVPLTPRDHSHAPPGQGPV